MKFWRISNFADLKGLGGIKGAGRWHNRGIPIVYLAESPALAMLETLVHFELAPDEIPDSYQLLEIEYNSRKGVSRLSLDSLPEAWGDDEEYTRAVGDDWLSSMSSLFLRVPSVIIPNSFNYLFNPRHELAKEAKIISVISQPYDQRLFGMSD